MKVKDGIEIKSIEDFVEGDRIQNFFIIKNMEVKLNKNNKQYIDLNLGDKTGEEMCIRDSYKIHKKHNTF